MYSSTFRENYPTLDTTTLFKALIDHFNGFISVVSPDDKVLFANKALVERTGFDPVGHICYNAFHGRATQCPFCPRDEVINQNKVLTWEKKSPLDGRWYNVVNTAVELRSGQKAMFALAIDVHDKKLAQEISERQRLLIETIWSKAPFLITGINPENGEIVYANNAYQTILGYSQEEIIGQRVFDLFSKEEQEQAFKCCREVCKGVEKNGVEFWWKSKDGEKRLLESTCFLVNSEDGQKVIFNIAKDITEEKRLQDQLVQAQKMEAIGRLAGGMAHDFNNLLTSIQGYLSLIESSKDDPQKLSVFLKNINLVLERSTDLTQRLLTFSGKRLQKSTVIDLPSFILDMHHFLQRLCGENIELEITLPEEDIFIYADQTHLQQIIMNLIVNAKDAMPNGGKILLLVELKESDHLHGALCEDSPESEWAVLTVIDSGCGIPEEVKHRIFEPFFTTKPPGEGTGLGLAMVYSLVKQYGGHITVSSEPGEGTTFKIYWPLTQEAEEPKEDSADVSKRHGGGETILVVEDDAMVRFPLTELIESAGYKVVEAENGEEALEILAKEKIDLIVSDLVMPKMDGAELTKIVQKTYPATKIILSSGYPENCTPENGKLRGVTFLAKPYSFSKLLNKIHTLLN